MTYAAAARRRYPETMTRADMEQRLAADRAAYEKRQAALDAAAAWRPRFKIGDVISATGASIKVEGLAARFGAGRYRSEGWTDRVEAPMRVRIIGYSQTHPGYLAQVVDGYAVGDGQCIVSVYVAPRQAVALAQKEG